MSAARLRWLELAAGLVALAAAVPVVWAVAQAMAVRLGYPGDLEWMEGATLVSAMRARDGLELYGEPTVEYIPFIYPPLHAWTLGALGHLFPLGYTLGRGVSIGAALAAAGALVFGARREGASWPLAVATLGLFAACWDDGGTFYDLVRTDSLSLALLAWALVTMPLGGRWIIGSGLLLAVAFTAKQHAALLGVPMLAWCWRTHGRAAALRFVAASAGPALVFLAAMTLATGGRFFTWLVLVPAAHGQDAERLFPGAQLELFWALPFTTALCFAAPAWAWRRAYWAGVALTTLGVVSLMRGHTGGFLNVLIPGFWVLSLLPAVAIPALRAPWARIAATVLVALQLAVWQTDFGRLRTRIAVGQAPLTAWTDSQRTFDRFVPNAEDTAAVTDLVHAIGALDGRVLAPHAPWYLVLAGKEPSFALICLWDIDYRHGPYSKDADRIDDAIGAEFDWAVVPDEKMGRGLKTHFERDTTRKLPSVGTRTGWPVRLRQVWRHRSAADEPTP